MHLGQNKVNKYSLGLKKVIKKVVHVAQGCKRSHAGLLLLDVVALEKFQHQSSLLV